MNVNTEYKEIKVESYLPKDTSGRHGKVHIRPLPRQEPFLPTMFVACSKDLSYDFPVGTKFLIKGKITQRKDGTPFIYSNYKWDYVVLK